MFPVNYLTTRVGKYTNFDASVVEHILKYLNGSIDRSLVASIDDTKNVKIQLFIDSSFHTHADGKSHSGACLSLGSGFVCWKSSKQTLTTKSSTEAELVALSDQSSLLFHMTKFLKGQGIDVQEKTIYQDNSSTIKLLHDPRSSSLRTAHINSKYYFLREHIEDKSIKIKKKSTSDMVADILTKTLHGKEFNKLSNLILGDISSN